MRNNSMRTVAFVSNSDLLGRRFNGFDYRDVLNSFGYGVEYFCFEKSSQLDFVHPIFPWRYGPKVKGLIDKLEDAISVQSVLYPFPYTLAIQKEFNRSDIIHYQMIHNSFFSLQFLPYLSRKRPSVWSLHDPWALTGHCVHPFSCQKWRNGCHDCPSLDTPKRLRNDTASLLWEYKRRTIQDSDITIHVLSDWMKDMIISSPIMRGKRVQKIPVGLDLTKFTPLKNSKSGPRRSMGIPEDAFVIMLRASKNPFKGIEIAKEILSRLNIDRKVVVLTIERKNMLEAIGNNVTVIDQGEVTVDELVLSYQISDCLLMTSTAESFGVMGVESMACGCPVVCLKGTALDQVLGESKALISIDKGDIDKILEEIKDLSENRARALEMAKASREFVEKRFEINNQVASMIRLYEEILNI